MKSPTKPSNEVGNQLLSTFLSKHEDSHYNNCNPVIYTVSTGSKRLDYYMDGGLGSGIHRFAGASEGGKTSASLQLVYNAFKTIKKCKCLFIKAEGRLSENVKQRSGLKFVEQDSNDWSNHSVFVLKSNVFEPVLDLMSSLIKDNNDGYVYIFIIDSMDGMNRKDDLTKKFSEDPKVAGVPLLTKQFFQRMSLPISENGHMAIIITQVSAEIKLKYEKSTQKSIIGSGGNALIHFPDWILVFEPTNQADYITYKKETMTNVDKDSVPILGHWAKILLRKTKNETTGYLVKYPIKHNRTSNPIWEEYEIFNFLVTWELIGKAGTRLKFSDNAVKIMQEAGIYQEKYSKVMGESAFLEFFEEEKALTNFWSDYYTKITSSKKISDREEGLTESE